MVQANDPAVAAAAANITQHVLFCVLDTGIDATNPDLAGNVLAGAGSCDPDAPSDCFEWQHDWLHHGTHVSGKGLSCRAALLSMSPACCPSPPPTAPW